MKKILFLVLFTISQSFSQTISFTKLIAKDNSFKFSDDSYIQSFQQSNIFNTSSFESPKKNSSNILITKDLNNLLPEMDPSISVNVSQFALKPLIQKNDSLHYDSTEKITQIDKIKFSIVTGSFLGIGVWFHFKQQHAWWRGLRGPFHIQNDWDYACQLDKFGHFFGGMITARTVMECYNWTGLDRNTSLWVGAACGAAWQTYVEIEDGFSKQWGFSPTDFYSDMLGAFYPVAQEYWEPLREINLKFSYLPSADLTTGTWKRGIFVQKDTFIDDYQGQMFWLTVNVNYFLPKDFKKYWPNWLQIALGYGLQKWDGDQEAMGHKVTDKELWLSFDYDIEKLPGDGEFLRLVKKLFNQFHLPAPAIRLTPGPIWYGLFFAHGL
jgi:hypothetical protein